MDSHGCVGDSVGAEMALCSFLDQSVSRVCLLSGDSYIYALPGGLDVLPVGQFRFSCLGVGEGKGRGEASRSSSVQPGLSLLGSRACVHTDRAVLVVQVVSTLEYNQTLGKKATKQKKKKTSRMVAKAELEAFNHGSFSFPHAEKVQ